MRMQEIFGVGTEPQQVVPYVVAHYDKTIALVEKEFCKRTVKRSWLVRYGVVNKSYYRASLFHAVCDMCVCRYEKGHPVADNQDVRSKIPDGGSGSEVACRVAAVEDAYVVYCIGSCPFFCVLAFPGKQEVGIKACEVECTDLMPLFL